jgi:hypothetical protein
MIIEWFTWGRSSLGAALQAQKFAGSIPDVNGILHWCKPSDRIIALGGDLGPVTNEYQDYCLEVRAAGSWGWQSYHLHLPIVFKSEGHNFLEPPGHIQTCTVIGLLFCFILI